MIHAFVFCRVLLTKPVFIRISSTSFAVVAAPPPVAAVDEDDDVEFALVGAVVP